MEKQSLKEKFLNKDVRLIQRIETTGGVSYPAGMILTVRSVWRGKLNFDVIRMVSPQYVEVINVNASHT